MYRPGNKTLLTRHFTTKNNLRFTVIYCNKCFTSAWMRTIVTFLTPGYTVSWTNTLCEAYRCLSMGNFPYDVCHVPPMHIIWSKFLRPPWYAIACGKGVDRNIQRLPSGLYGPTETWRNREEWELAGEPYQHFVLHGQGRRGRFIHSVLSH